VLHMKVSEMLRMILFTALLGGLSYGQCIGPTKTLDRYLRARETQEPDVQETPIEVDIDASLPQLNKHGRMHGIRLLTRAGQVVYSELRFRGDNTIKTQVIARYLNAEAQSRSAVEDVTISLVNYRLDYKGIADYAGRPAYVYQIEPRWKRVGLFRGELWLDPATALPFREWGDLVKSGSAFVKHVRFVRDYFLDRNHADLRRLILTADAFMVGEVDMTVWFGIDAASRNSQQIEEPATDGIGTRV
jgi:hypothetical protein